MNIGLIYIEVTDGRCIWWRSKRVSVEYPMRYWNTPPAYGTILISLPPSPLTTINSLVAKEFKCYFAGAKIKL